MSEKKENKHKNAKEKDEGRREKQIENKEQEKNEVIEIPIPGKAIVVALLLLAVVVGFVAGQYYAGNGESKVDMGEGISEKEAGELAKNTFLQSISDYYKSMGMEFDPSSLDVQVSNVKRYNDYMYEITFTVNGKEYPQPMYLSIDGKDAFLGRISVVKEFKAPSLNITKSEKPEVKINVMSFCPYGNQAENALKEVIDLLADKADFVPYYIIYKGENPYQKGEDVEVNGEKYWSLHGNNELYEDIREKIIYELYGIKKWAEFVVKVNEQCNLENVETCWKEVAQEVGINVSEVEDEYNKRFNDLVLQEYEATAAQGISGSPTILINDYTYKKSRTAEAFKQTICDAFVEPPEECGNVKLSEEESAVQGSCG